MVVVATILVVVKWIHAVQNPRSNDDPSCGSSFQVELLVESVGSLVRGQMWLEVLVLALLSSMSSAGVVEYNLTIGYFIARPDGCPVTVLGINGQLPSPTLEVTRGDTLVVHVHNNDQAHAHSLHWHGLAMKGAPEYDGVAGVTQCGILPFSSMTYRFVVLDEPGTYWYHGHAGLSHAGVRGIAGPLLVQPRPGDEVHEGTYSRDLLLYVTDWAHEPSAEHYANSKAGFHEAVAQSAQWHNVALYKWTSALINGLGGHYGGVYSILNVVRGETTRLRTSAMCVPPSVHMIEAHSKLKSERTATPHPPLALQ